MPRRKRFTADEIKRITDAYAAGDAPASIGKRVDCGSGTIVRVLKSEGV